MLSRTAGAIGLVLACLCTSNALFEDQAGKVDWCVCFPASDNFDA